MHHHDIDRLRRRMLVTGTLAGGCGLLSAARLRAAAPATAMATLLEELPYGLVQLRPGPLFAQAQQNHQFLLGLDEDALLRPFRERAGQKAPGADMGGWYGTYAFAPGATFGHWVSALSRYHAISGDVAARRKVGRLVRGLAETVTADGRFYVDNRFPSYIYDKLVGALVDARRLTGDTLAVPTLARATSAALPFLPPHAMARNEHAEDGQDFSEHAWDESYTIPENQFFAYHLTGDARHAELARRFLYDEFFLALARGENALPGKHAYSHVNALGSAAQAYLSLGEAPYLDAARNGFSMLLEQSYATGGWGPDEHFIVPGSGALGKSLDGEHKSFETPCGAYAHLKLARYLLRVTGDAAYGDSMERVLYNTVLGALPLQSDGRAFYYSDYTRSASKQFHPDHWPCCSGTLPLVAADYPVNVALRGASGLWVNLYVPAEITWTEGSDRYRLRIETEYPYADTVRLLLEAPTERSSDLHLRIPAWAHGAQVRIEGQGAPIDVEAGKFARLNRRWRPRQWIELTLPRALRLEPVDAEHPDTVALMCGPLVLMRCADSPGSASRNQLLTARQAPGAGREWLAGNSPEGVRLRAFADLSTSPYRAYHDVRTA